MMSGWDPYVSGSQLQGEATVGDAAFVLSMCSSPRASGCSLCATNAVLEALDPTEPTLTILAPWASSLKFAPFFLLLSTPLLTSRVFLVHSKFRCPRVKPQLPYPSCGSAGIFLCSSDTYPSWVAAAASCSGFHIAVVDPGTISKVAWGCLNDIFSHSVIGLQGCRITCMQPWHIATSCRTYCDSMAPHTGEIKL